ncbi:MAG: hypothetical protein ACI4XJ_02385 [Eubacteriales bacterium]
MSTTSKTLPTASVQKRAKHRFLVSAAIISLVLIAAARVSTYICTLSSTDIAYPEWVEIFTSYLSETLSALRLAVSFAAICYAVYYRLGSASAVVFSLLFSLADFSARFLIDLSMGAIIGSETFALIWLGINFVYEFVFIMLSYFAARILKLKSDGTDDVRRKKRYTIERAILVSVGLYLLSRVISELFYLVDFLLSYVNITNTEIASMVGSFLKIFVIYGGAAYLFAYFCILVFKRVSSLPHINKEENA